MKIYLTILIALLSLVIIQPVASQSKKEFILLNKQDFPAYFNVNPDWQKKSFPVNLKKTPLHQPNSLEFFEDFENDFPTGNWDTYDQDSTVNGEYYWGKTTHRKFEGAASVWCAAGGADGYDPSEGDYPGFMNSGLTWGPVDLSNATSSKFYLNFWLESDNSNNYDGLYWGAARGDSIIITPYSGSSGGWVRDSIDVSDLQGTNWLGFNDVYFIAIFLSDPDSSAEGAYIDNVKISVVSEDPPPFSDIQADLTPMKDGAVAWGDYDNDGYFDLLMTGVRSSNYYAIVYHNNKNSTFSDINAGLEPLTYGSSTWGDFDNDGDLDILHTGYNGSRDLLLIYRNDGGGDFTDINANLEALEYPFAVWGDYDNDGDLDILTTGSTGSQPKTIVYQNNGAESFTKIEIDLETNLYNGSIINGDYDNDGDLDFVLTGRTTSRARSLIYRNDGDFSFTRINPHFEGVVSRSGGFGDYDNDGDLDLLLTGSDLNDNPFTELYRNNGADNFTKINAKLKDCLGGGAVWGDYDNDGDLDILLTGLNGTNDLARLYRNEGSDYFVEIENNFPNAAGPCAWADFDKDDDLDIVFTGWNGSRDYFAAVYRNNSAVPNSNPHRPAELAVAVDGNSVTLSWNDAGDSQTPSRGLSYNVYLGTSSGGDEIMPSHASNNSGRRRIVATGNCQQVTSWKINDLPDGQYFWSVQAIDAAFEGSRFPEENSFIISSAALALTAPNGGEVWVANSVEQITWTAENVTSVKLEYSADDQAAWHVIEENVSAELAAYDWTIPDLTSEKCFVRISDVANDYISDTSDAAFSILQPVISVVTPNGGENWLVDSTYAITWTSDYVENIKIEYSTNGGNDWQLIEASLAAVDQSYNWIIPDTPSPTCLVKISMTANTAINDISDALFAISRPSIRLTVPNGGESWCVDSTKAITWTAENVDQVKIEYSTDGAVAWQTIVENIPSAPSSYDWTIPNSPSENCFVRVSAVNNAAINDQSDAAFSISLPTITVTAPAGGEQWCVDSSYTIKWKSYHVANIKIEYSYDGAVNWEPVAENVPATPSNYLWKIPNTPSANCWIKISAMENLEIQDVSNDSFTICQPQIALVVPNGGEKWRAASQQSIRWTADYVAQIKLEYSTDGTQTWQLIKTGIPAAPPVYTWDVPGTLSTNCFVRVSDAANPELYDVSDDSFVVFQPEITLTSPNGGELLQVDSTHQITWTASHVADIKLEYSIDEAASWLNIADSVAADSAKYLWTIPNTISEKCLVRVSALSDSLINDVSDAVFEIYLPTLAVIAPNGGEEWEMGSTQNIEWESNKVDLVNIFYSLNNGAVWDTVIVNISSAETYAWQLPETPGQECLVKIEAAANPEIQDVSDSTFVIYDPAAGIDKNALGKPAAFALQQNYPNPFNPVTKIVYALPEAGFVTITVYDFRGREVAALVQGKRGAGVHEVDFHTKQFASGIYFYTMNSGKFSETRKMILLK